MKLNILHSIVACIAVFALPFVVSCSQDQSFPDDTGEATLLLNIEAIEASGAGTAMLPDNEKMHNIRVVILTPDGIVEHNKFYDLEEAQIQKSVLLKVAPGNGKKIFLFANEECVNAVEGIDGKTNSLTAFFDSYSAGDSGFETAVNRLYFAPDYTGGKYIPMSSVYVEDIPRQETVEKTFYVVRVATKFTVNFFNLRGEDVCIDKLSIAYHADKNFLMAHVKDTPQNQAVLGGKTWINWLKEVSDASSENDDYTATEAAGWLKDYELPALADKRQTYTNTTRLTVAAAEFDENNLEDITPGKTTQVFYLPESMNLKSGTADGEQEYILSVNIEGASEQFERTIPNLKALFRNTNVVLNITMDKNMEIMVEVIPFTSVEVNPDFGLNRDEFTGYVEGKDNDGHPCWYDKGTGPYYLGPKDNPGDSVKINGRYYLLVYSDYNRASEKLVHFYDTQTREKFILTPEAITGYRSGPDMYYNDLNQRVWLDSGGDPNGNADERSIYEAFEKIDLPLKCCRIVYEWDRLNWNEARWWLLKNVYPKYWFDIFGNRYPWLEDDIDKNNRIARLKEKIGEEWIKYLE